MTNGYHTIIQLQISLHMSFPFPLMHWHNSDQHLIALHFWFLSTEQPSVNRLPGKVWIIKMSAAAQGQLQQQRHKVLAVEFLVHPCYSQRKIPDGGQAPSVLILLAICSHWQRGAHPVAWRQVFGMWQVMLQPLHRFWILRKLEPLKIDNASITNLVTCLQHFICCNVQLRIITFRTFHCCIPYVSHKYAHLGNHSEAFLHSRYFPSDALLFLLSY